MPTVTHEEGGNVEKAPLPLGYTCECSGCTKCDGDCGNAADFNVSGDYLCSECADAEKE